MIEKIVTDLGNYALTLVYWLKMNWFLFWFRTFPLEEMNRVIYRAKRDLFIQYASKEISKGEFEIVFHFIEEMESRRNGVKKKCQKSAGRVSP